MSRAQIESAVHLVVEAGRREGSESSVDYANFLLSANGIRINFSRRRIPDPENPAYIFRITGIPETFFLTRAGRQEIALY